ncbi:MAG TPA: SBBP repeat-containing protein [Ignavibacteria bacterium]|nr:SBBP repeat-containing protein [Ignavibacteria bacterium]
MIFRYILNIVFIIICITEVALSQYAPEEEWNARFNGTSSGNDYAYDMEVDAEGNAYVTGIAFMNGARKIVTIKYNSQNIIMWFAEYNGAPNNLSSEQVHIKLDNSGNVYVTAATDGAGDDITLIKYNPFGNEQWVKKYSGAGSFADEPRGLAIDNSGNIFVCGRIWNGAGGDDYVTLKYNTAGELLWSKTYNGTGNNNDQPNSITINLNDDVFVTGQSFGNGTARDYVTIKYNSNGDEQWVKRYSHSANRDDIATTILSNGSDVIVTGYSYDLITRNDIVTIKYNSNGDQVWSARYNGPTDSTDKAYSMTIDPAGNIFIAGESFRSTARNMDMCAVKYNSNGNQLLTFVYNHPTSTWIDVAKRITYDNIGNVYLGGHSWIVGQEYNYNVVCFKPDGEFFWSILYNGPRNKTELMYDMILLNNRYIYVTGYSMGNTSMNDYATVKYSQQVGINIVSSQTPSSYKLYQNYPNPFNPSTKIAFDLPKRDFVSLKLYDVTGKEVKTLLNADMNIGKYEYELNASDLNSGIYFYTLITSSFKETKKMLLVK